MALDRAANVRILIVVGVVRRAEVLLVQHQPSRQQFDIRQGAYPCHMIVGAAKPLVAGGHSSSQRYQS